MNMMLASVNPEQLLHLALTMLNTVPSIHNIENSDAKTAMSLIVGYIIDQGTVDDEEIHAKVNELLIENLLEGLSREGMIEVDIEDGTPEFTEKGLNALVSKINVAELHKRLNDNEGEDSVR